MIFKASYKKRSHYKIDIRKLSYSQSTHLPYHYL